MTKNNILQLAHYRFNFRVVDDFYLHSYAGSALRGAFGHALMQLCGIQKSDVINTTPLYQHSPYAEIFESKATQLLLLEKGIKDLPAPFIIRAPAVDDLSLEEGEQFSFELVLVGDVLEHLSLIILAFRRAMLRGLGKHKSNKAELTSVELLQKNQESLLVYTEDKPVVQAHPQIFVMPEFTQAKTLHVKVKTPLRIQHDGKILKPDELTASIFIKTLVRRCRIYWLLQQREDFDLDELFALAETVQSEKYLEYRYWARYSSRQRQTMHLDGAVGEWTFYDVPPQLLPYFYLGEHLHNGKNAVFGLGHFEVQEIK